MPVIQRTRRATREVGKLLLMLGRLPAKIAHEMTHLLFLAPWLQHWRIQIDHELTEVVVDVDDDIPRWAFVLGHLAPFVVGVTLATVMVVWALLAGMPIPKTVSGWGQLGIACLLWVTYSWPSAEDRQPETIDGGQAND